MMRWIAITAALIVAVSGGAADAAPDPTLVRAYASLKVGNFKAARQLATLYLASNPRRFDADFILAYAGCMLQRGTPDAQQRAAALADDYTLAGLAAKQVGQLEDACRPPPPPPPDHDDNGIGMTASALSVPPGFDIAEPGDSAAAPLPKMTRFSDGVSFSGGDYDHRTTATAEVCARICRLQSRCRSMTFVKSGRVCWLKDSVPPPQYGPDFVSSRKIVIRSLPASAP